MAQPRKTYAPGRTKRNGYGAEHKRLRAQWAVVIARGEAVCWRCGQPIHPQAAWDLGHDDYDRTVYRGPEHAGRCNRAAAARKVNALRRAQRHGQDVDWLATPNPSRDW